MKVRSIKPRGQRIFKSTHKYRPFWIEPTDINWWFNLSTGEWETEDNYNGGGRTSTYYAMKYHGFKDIRSLKAAKRTISKWNIPKGTTFRVGLPWVGYDFFVTK